MFSTLFLLLMLSTLQRKENRLIEQTVFFALYESPFHAVYAHECILYKKEINMILPILISFCWLILSFYTVTTMLSNFHFSKCVNNVSGLNFYHGNVSNSDLP